MSATLPVLKVKSAQAMANRGEVSVLRDLGCSVTVHYHGNRMDIEAWFRAEGTHDFRTGMERLTVVTAEVEQ